MNVNVNVNVNVIRMATAIIFSRQNDAGSRTRTT